MATIETVETEPRRESFLATAGYFIRRYPLGAAGAVIVTTFVLMAIFAPWITLFDPTATNSRVSLAYPGGDHPLGAVQCERAVREPCERVIQFRLRALAAHGRTLARTAGAEQEDEQAGQHAEHASGDQQRERVAIAHST